MVGGGGGGWWVVVCKPILVFTLSLGQAEQKHLFLDEWQAILCDQHFLWLSLNFLLKSHILLNFCM